jgi:hypothetical protein
MIQITRNSKQRRETEADSNCRSDSYEADQEPPQCPKKAHLRGDSDEPREASRKHRNDLPDAGNCRCCGSDPNQTEQQCVQKPPTPNPAQQPLQAPNRGVIVVHQTPHLPYDRRLHNSSNPPPDFANADFRGVLPLRSVSRLLY